MLARIAVTLGYRPVPDVPPRAALAEVSRLAIEDLLAGAPELGELAERFAKAAAAAGSAGATEILAVNRFLAGDGPGAEHYLRTLCDRADVDRHRWVSLRAANLIGDGLYGVDLKQTQKGVVVIEVNDNPNIDAGVEDKVLKDELYRILIADFVERLDRRRQAGARALPPAG